jgi:hypothetical protein
MRDGGRPHDAASMARISRLPVEVFREVLPRLLSIGWLAVLGQDAAEILQDAARGVERADSGTHDAAGESDGTNEQETAPVNNGFPDEEIKGHSCPKQV